MHLPGTPSLFFIGVLLLFMPYAAIRSAARLRAAREGARVIPSREKIWTSMLVVQAALFSVAWFTGRGFGFHPFALPKLSVRLIAASLAALVLLLVLRAFARAGRTEDERRRMTVYQIAPRNPREWVWWSATVVAASIAEETAYRGVGFSILWYALGNPWIAALLCAVAFALAHWTQGLRSGVAIFGIALVMHALVAVTGSLVPAMVIHGAYDFIAGIAIARRAQRYDAEARAPSPVPPEPV